MDEILIKRKFSPMPVLVQFIVLLVAVFVIEAYVKPVVSEEDQYIANVASYSFYVFVLLGLLEILLRGIAVQESIAIGEKGLIISKKSIIPIPWFNHRREVPYGNIVKLMLSKEALDLGQNEQFYDEYARTIKKMFLAKKSDDEEKKVSRGLHFMTLMPYVGTNSFKVGMFDLYADVSNYNIPISEKDMALVLGGLNNHLAIDLIFN